MRALRLFAMVVAAGAGSPAFAQAPAPPPAAAPPAAPAEPVLAPGERIAVGQAPVVGGNAAGARERALDEAIRQAVDQALAELVDAATRAAQAKAIRTLEAKARSFVPRYRTLEEGEANGVYTVRLQAEVDDVALRRRIESWTSGPVPPPAVRGAPTALLMAPGDDATAAAGFVPALAASLASAGSPARVATARPAPNTPAALVTINVTDDGPVRGTADVAAACHAAVHFVSLTLNDQEAVSRGFAENPADARAACQARLAPLLAAQVAANLAAASPAGGDLPAVLVDADVTEPAAVAGLLKSVREVGAVSGADLLRVGAGRVEIRARTRSGAASLAAALSRDATPMISLTDVQASGDTIRLRARLRAPQTPEPGSSP